MRGGHSLPAALAGLILTAAALAQPAGTGAPPAGGTAPATGGQTTTTKAADAPTNATPAGKGEGGSCLFFGPTFGSEVLNLGWNTSPGSIGVLPGVRAGLWMPNGFLSADLGL